MKKIGIVYAISRTAGDHCKKLINANSENKVEIVTHECPSDAYKAAANDLNKIAGLFY